MPKLRPIDLDAVADVREVLDLNARDVHWLSPMDEDRLRVLVELADRADILEVDDNPAGFVICFGPDAKYDSPFYRWHAEHYADFYYLDRIVLNERLRRQGLASFMYDELETVAREHGRMNLEVSIGNEASLAFHRNRGYVDVADLEDAPGHLVTLMVKELPGPS